MGNLTDAVRRMIESLQISSASPGHINEVLQIDTSIDLDSILEQEEGAPVEKQKGEFFEKGKESVREETDEIKRVKKLNVLDKKFKRFDDGQVGEIQRMTEEQFGNLQAFVKSPVGFIMGRVFGRIAKGVGLIAFAFIFVDIVKYVLEVLLFAPGKPMDKRFKLLIERQILKFRTREEEVKLKQGLSQIIITTMVGLRGGQGQTYNTFNHVRDRTLPPTLGQPILGLLASGLSTSKIKGRGRYDARFAR